MNDYCGVWFIVVEGGKCLIMLMMIVFIVFGMIDLLFVLDLIFVIYGFIKELYLVLMVNVFVLMGLC